MPSAWNTIHHRGNKVFFTEEVSFFSQRNRVDAFGMEYDSSQRKYGFFHRGIEWMPSAWNTIHHRGNKVFFTEEVRFYRRGIE